MFLDWNHLLFFFSDHKFCCIYLCHLLRSDSHLCCQMGKFCCMGWTFGYCTISNFPLTEDNKSLQYNTMVEDWNWFCHHMGIFLPHSLSRFGHEGRVVDRRGNPFYLTTLWIIKTILSCYLIPSVLLGFGHQRYCIIQYSISCQRSDWFGQMTLYRQKIGVVITW